MDIFFTEYRTPLILSVMALLAGYFVYDQYKQHRAWKRAEAHLANRTPPADIPQDDMTYVVDLVTSNDTPYEGLLARFWELTKTTTRPDTTRARHLVEAGQPVNVFTVKDVDGFIEDRNWNLVYALLACGYTFTGPQTAVIRRKAPANLQLKLENALAA